MSAPLFGRLSSSLIFALSVAEPVVSDESRTLDCEAAFLPEATATSLEAQFGSELVVSAAIEIGEGSSEVGTVIFANSAKDRMEILWKDVGGQRAPRTVGIRGDESRWATVQGVTLGLDLKTLERVNGRPFTLMGFGWDYEGTVVSWSGGLLDVFSDRCRILVRLAPKLRENDPQWAEQYEQVSGDRPFSSDNPLMQELNPTIYEVKLRY